MNRKHVLTNDYDSSPKLSSNRCPEISESPLVEKNTSPHERTQCTTTYVQAAAKSRFSLAATVEQAGSTSFSSRPFPITAGSSGAHLTSSPGGSSPSSSRA